LFYLPFEHGGQGLQLLHEFNWLKSNAHLVTHANCTKKNVTTDQEAPKKPEVMQNILVYFYHQVLKNYSKYYLPV
jgi:protein O-GlcNAcase/histone acetyltransferase